MDSSVQDCNNSIANALELLQSCAKPSTSSLVYLWIMWSHLMLSLFITLYMTCGYWYWNVFVSIQVPDQNRNDAGSSVLIPIWCWLIMTYIVVLLNKDGVWQTPEFSVLFATILPISTLTHWGWDEMATISQTPFSNTLSWMKIVVFWWKFHWNLFLRVQLTIFHYWFT